MSYITSIKARRTKNLFIAALFVLAQMSFGLNGSNVLAAEDTNANAAAAQDKTLPEAATTHSNSLKLAERLALEAVESAQQTNTTPPANANDGQNANSIASSVSAVTQKNDTAPAGLAIAAEHNNAAQQVAAVNTNNTVAVTEDSDEDKVTLCHATGSNTNPFEKITVAAAAAYSGHLGGGHQNGEDIIPPFTYQDQSYSQNWNTAGQATFNNNCVSTTGGSNGDTDEDKVTLCHATGSNTNPFVRITVAAAGAFNGHLGSSHQNGEDIIPPFTYQGQSYSQNWNAAGQATFNNGCVPTTTGSTPDGGLGGGTVLGATTPDNAGGQGALVDTGSNILLSTFMGLAILGLTASLYAVNRKQYNV